MFKLTIKTDSAAFENNCREEIALILEDLVQKIRNAEELSILLDSNGNSVGSVIWGI